MVAVLLMVVVVAMVVVIMVTMLLVHLHHLPLVLQINQPGFSLLLSHRIQVAHLLIRCFHVFTETMLQMHVFTILPRTVPIAHEIFTDFWLWMKKGAIAVGSFTSKTVTADVNQINKRSIGDVINTYFLFMKREDLWVCIHPENALMKGNSTFGEPNDLVKIFLREEAFEAGR